MQDTIDYGLIIDNAMRNVVAEALKIVAINGISNDHSLYISFNTRARGVQLSEGLKKRYLEEITIVLQHQFEDLIIEKDRFRVTLRFDDLPEEVIVPFSALTSFADPGAKFALEFSAPLQQETSKLNTESIVPIQKPSKTPEGIQKKLKTQDSSNVITLDKFRNKD
ncbi:MAG: ClpXP protease specificity-enhancing factor SspB [Pseudomonadota bacterium]